MWQIYEDSTRRYSSYLLHQQHYPLPPVLNVPASFSLPMGQCTPNVQPDLSGLTTSVAIHRAVWSHYLRGNTHPKISQICLVSLLLWQYTDLSGLTTSGAIYISVWSHYLSGNTHPMFSQICLVSLPLGQYTDVWSHYLSGNTQCSTRSA